MTSRLVTLMAAAVATVSVVLAVTRGASPSSTSTGSSLPRSSLSPRLASYLGVYEKGPPSTFQPVTDFAAAAGRHPNLVGYYGGWGEAFKRSFAETVRRHGAVTILQMDPTYASIPAIVAGSYDRYLRSFADSVRGFGHPVIIGFGHEMNADWYSWGYGHVPSRTFVAAWRHIVSLFRGQGADKVTWLWTINQDLPGTGPIASWWPGAHYVTWVGIDGYYYRPSSTFATVFGQTIAQVRAFTSKPLLLSETAVGPQAGQAVENPGTVRRDAAVPGPRAGVVRHRPAPRDLPSGLAYRGQPARHRGVPAGRVLAGPGPPVTCGRPRKVSVVLPGGNSNRQTCLILRQRNTTLSYAVPGLVVSVRACVDPARCTRAAGGGRDIPLVAPERRQVRLWITARQAEICSRRSLRGDPRRRREARARPQPGPRKSSALPGTHVERRLATDGSPVREPGLVCRCWRYWWYRRCCRCDWSVLIRRSWTRRHTCGPGISSGRTGCTERRYRRSPRISPGPRSCIRPWGRSRTASGGLAGARLLSLAFMLSTTVLLWERDEQAVRASGRVLRRGAVRSGGPVAAPGGVCRL